MSSLSPQHASFYDRKGELGGIRAVQRVRTPPPKLSRQTPYSCVHIAQARIDHPENAPLVKICGVTNVKDAVMAAEAGASYVGMILWPKSKRSITVETAKDIACAVRVRNAEPVGVFVDEDAEDIMKCCKSAGIGIAQLHGERARSSLLDLPSYLKKIYVVHVDASGGVQTAMPAKEQVEWILLDSLQGGSGHSFDWDKLKSLNLGSKYEWFLAGGLNAENVAKAISILSPFAVDVSSGVTEPDGIVKDRKRIWAFVNAVRSSGD